MVLDALLCYDKPTDPSIQCNMRWRCCMWEVSKKQRCTSRTLNFNFELTLMLDIVISVKNWIEKIQRPVIYLHINNDSTNLPLKLLVHSKWREERKREGDINPVESLFVEWHDGDWCFYVFFGVFFFFKRKFCVCFLSIKLCSFASVKWAQTNIACGILCDWLDPVRRKKNVVKLLLV